MGFSVCGNRKSPPEQVVPSFNRLDEKWLSCIDKFWLGLGFGFGVQGLGLRLLGFNRV